MLWDDIDLYTIAEWLSSGLGKLALAALAVTATVAGYVIFASSDQQAPGQTAGAFKIWQAPMGHKPNDRNCFPSRLPQRAVTIGIDLTDDHTLTHDQINRIKDLIGAEAQSIRQHDHLSVVALAASSPNEYPELLTLLDVCKPKSPVDVDPFSESKPSLEKIWQQRWQKPLLATLNKIKDRSGSGAARSPIMAAIKKLALGQNLTTAASSKLIWISDMLEHSDHFTFLDRQRARNLAFADIAEYDIGHVSNILSGVVVEIYLLSRKNWSVQESSAHKQFWHDWFKAAGSSYQPRIL